MSHAHPARQSTEPFTLHLTAVGKGKSCSSELRRPEPLEIAFGATYHDLVMDNNGSASGGRGGPRSSPWVGNIDIEKHFIDSFSTTLIGSHNENSRHLNLPTSNSSPISFGKITPIPAIASSAPLIRPAPLPTYNNSIGHSLTHVSLPRTSAPPEIPGYKVAPVGQLQILIKSLSVPIKVFIVPYDLRHLSAGSRLLVGEKSYLVSGSELKSRAPAASPGSLLISEARGMGKGKSKESLKSAIQLQFVCCSTASTPGPEPASVRAPAKEQVRSPGHLSYYVAKSIRVVFSSPSHTADEMRTERHDEVVKPPVPTAASSPEREIGIVDDAALLFPHGLDRQPATSGVSARPEIERLRDIGWQGESLHDRYDHENDRNEPSIKRRDSLGKGNQKEGGGLLLSSFSPGSSSLGRRLEWEMIRRRWFAKSQSQVPQDDDKRNEQVFATQDALDNNQEDGNGNDKDVLVGHTENLTANAHTPISQPQSDQHQTNLNFDPNLVRRQFTKAIEPIRPSLERKPSLLSTTQPDSLQASVPTAPLAGRVQRKDGQMTSAPSEAMGPAEPTHLPSSEVTTLSIAGKGDRDGAGNRASSPSPLPPPISIVSPTPHKIALDGHGHGHGHFKSKNASQSHLSFSLSAKRTSGPKPSAIATSSSSRSRTASPIPPSSSSSAARATVGIINDNQRERERERGRASTATPPLIWSPTSNVNRRMTREDGQEEVELSEKLRKMGLDVSRR
ncbi:hypothetical protein I317_00050 [Kwoniella heveanensis CBS 569]|nr:hypothetical protein I317_00050 [Kwoniella heveanensis CBS 569]